MKSSTDRRIKKSISSQRTTNSEIQREIINLGNALIKELNLEPGTDTAARWMAHYIAEQISISKKSTGKKKTEAEQRCFDTILKLWEHRSNLPDGHRPFMNYEQIFRVIERLDPENDQTYYYNFIDKVVPKSKNTKKVTKEVKYWLDIALVIDQVARIWLNTIFKEAISCATDKKTNEWLNKSLNLKINDEFKIILQFLPKINSNSDDSYIKKIKDEQIEVIKDRIKKLEAFNKFNNELLLVYKKEIEKILENNSSIDNENIK